MFVLVKKHQCSSCFAGARVIGPVIISIHIMCFCLYDFFNICLYLLNNNLGKKNANQIGPPSSISVCGNKNA